MKTRFNTLYPLTTLMVMAWLITGCATLNVSVGGGTGSLPPQGPTPAEYPTYKALNIPPGHLPPPGSCRIWKPGAPPGQQKPPMDCDDAFQIVPAGYWVIEHLNSNEALLHVHEAHRSRPGVIIDVEIYSIR